MHNTVFPSEFEMDRTSRYEAHLQRQAVHTLRQLLVRQARRRGDPMYFPRFSLTGSTDMRDGAVGKPVLERSEGTQSGKDGASEGSPPVS